MRILITGAYGFIGQHISAELRMAGHEIVAGVRYPSRWLALYPDEQAVACDFNRDITVEAWLPRLRDIDVVINCVGILQERGKESIEAVHYLTPRALFDASQQVGIKKIIHVSALGVDKAADNPYAQTKHAAEEYLKGLATNWVIVRPSLVYSTGSWGGTSLFRALAAMPWWIPLVGDGQQTFQPIFARDLARAIRCLTERPEINHQCFDAVGPEQTTIATITARLRNWLRLGKSRFLRVPLPLIRIASRLGDWFGAGPLNSTSYSMLQYDNTTTEERQQAFFNAIGFEPSSMAQVLAAYPSQQQDRWHARLYFLQPALRVSIAIVWLLSGLVPLLFVDARLDTLLSALGIPEGLVNPLLYITIFWDIGLGLATLLNWRIKLVGGLQLVTLVCYTFFCSLWLTELWLNPFGPILKNIPLIIATLMMMATDD